MSERNLELEDSDSMKIAPIEILSIEEGFNPRRELEIDSQFLETIREHGVMTPIIVRNNPKKAGHFSIIDGHRRFTAAQQVKLTEIPVVHIEPEEGGDVDDMDALILAVIANEQRPLTNIEKAEAYLRIRENSEYSDEDIATQLGISKRTLLETARILEKGSEDIQEAVKSEDPEEHIPTRVAARVVELPEEEQEGVVEEVKGKSTEEGLRAVQKKEKEIGKVNRGRKPKSVQQTTRSGVPFAGDAKTRVESLHFAILDSLMKDPANEAAHRHLEVLWIMQGDRDVADLYPGNGRKPNTLAKIRQVKQIVKEHEDQQGEKAEAEAPKEGTGKRKRMKKTEFEAQGEAPKRRGRPPKSETTGEAPKKRGRPKKTETTDAAPKRRGRPPKAKVEGEAPKKRGRPPKAKVEGEAPKRRGRPPKVKTEETSSATTTTVKKRRGRPKGSKNKQKAAA